MNESSMTFVVVVFTAIVALIIAKLAPALHKEEKKCPPCPPCPTPQPNPWRFLGGTLSIKRKQEIEENYHGFMPPEGK